MTSIEEARAALRARLGGKVTTRPHGLSRNQAVVRSDVVAGPDNIEKVRSTLQKMGGSTVGGCEVVFFKQHGDKVEHFVHPKVTIAPNHNTVSITGPSTEKPEEDYNTDKQILELIQKFSMHAPKTDALEEVPELVPEDFEQVANQEDKKDEPQAPKEEEEGKADALD